MLEKSLPKPGQFNTAYDAQMLTYDLTEVSDGANKPRMTVCSFDKIMQIEFKIIERCRRALTTPNVNYNEYEQRTMKIHVRIMNFANITYINVSFNVIKC